MYNEVSGVGGKATYEAFGEVGRALNQEVDYRVGNWVELRLSRAEFTVAEQNLVDFKYGVANYRLANSLETAAVGAKVSFDPALSKQFAIHELQPAKPSLQKIPEGYQVDEFVSRHIGGRQVLENQWFIPNESFLNQSLGGLEKAAVDKLPTGMTISGFRVIWSA